MIVKTVLEQLAARLPQNQFVSFHQVMRAVESVFGKEPAHATARLNMLQRRHINLLAALRAKGVTAVGNDRDEWAVEVPEVVRREMSVATKYIDVVTMGGVLRYVREDATIPQSAGSQS